jgi:hypothetical protein
VEGSCRTGRDVIVGGGGGAEVAPCMGTTPEEEPCTPCKRRWHGGAIDVNATMLGVEYPLELEAQGEPHVLFLYHD